MLGQNRKCFLDILAYFVDSKVQIKKFSIYFFSLPICGGYKFEPVCQILIIKLKPKPKPPLRNKLFEFTHRIDRWQFSVPKRWYLRTFLALF